MTTSRVSSVPAFGFRRLLLVLSGADLEVLERHPGEIGKFVNLGGTVLSAAAFATVSMTCTLVMALRLAVPAALFAGVLWGLVIGNLDRLLVTAARRQSTPRRTFAIFVPRLALAGVLGVVISTPLVLAVFAPEIAVRVQEIHAQEAKSYAQQLARDPEYRTIPALAAQQTTLQNTAAGGAGIDVSSDPTVADLTRQLDTLLPRYYAAEQAVVCEVAGTCGDHHVGKGPVYWEKVRVRDGLKSEVKQLKTELRAAEQRALERLGAASAATKTDALNALPEVSKRLTDLRMQLDSAIAQHRRQLANDHGLLTRLEALDQLTGQSFTAFTTHWLLACLLVIIECSAVVMKMLMLIGKPSAYEIGLAAKDDVARAEEDARRNALVAQTRVEWGGIEDDIAEQRRREAERAAIDHEIAMKAYTEVSQATYDAWKEAAIRQVQQDPARFVVLPTDRQQSA